MRSGLVPHRAAPVAARGAVGVALGAGLLPCALAPLPATAATRAVLRTATAVVADPVSLGVESIDPLVLAPTSTLTISGTLVNHGSAALTSTNIQLRVSKTPVGSRSQLAALALASATRPPGDPVPGAQVLPPGSIGPGESLAWTITTSAASLGLTAPGVYPVAIEVIAQDPVTGERTRFGTARTFLPWNLGSAKPTRVAVVWPVLGLPARAADGSLVGTAVQDQVTGRLEDLLDAADGSHLTWLVDGDTVESVQELAHPTVTKPSPTPTPSATGSTPGATDSPTTSSNSGTATDLGASEASAWLARFADEAATGEVLAVPFGDPDLVATVRAGRTSDIGTGATLGTQVVTQVLGGGITVGGDVAWPAEGTADRATLNVLAGQGAAAVLLSNGYARPAKPVTTYTASGIGPLTGTTMTAVTADSVLSALLAAPSASQGGPALAQQRFLAELAMVTAELPSAGRSIVIVPPRRWSPDVPFVRGALDALGRVPWVQPATLGELRTTASAGPARARPSYPKAVRGREVESQQLDGVRVGSNALDNLLSVVANPVSLRNTYVRALLRAESTVWRGSRTDGITYVHTVDDLISAKVAAVHVVEAGALTLAARSGKIPVTVENGLDQAVTMQLSVAADPAVRLTLTQPAKQSIPAGQSRTFEVPAEATTNGNVQLVVRLLTPDGKPYGSAVSFPVQITGFGAVAQIVVGGAFLLLAITLIVRVARAIRRGRRRGAPAVVPEQAR